jgi:predicted P-type ATPase
MPVSLSRSSRGVRERESEMSARPSNRAGSNLEKTLLDDMEFDIDIAAHKVSDIIQRPYQTNQYGNICHALWNIVSISWVLMYFVIIFDYYLDCQVKGVDNLCYYGTYPIFGSHDTSSQYFFTVWCLSSAWYLFSLLYKDQMRLWFMVPCAMTDATHMYIWTKDEVITESSSSDTMMFVLWIRELRIKLTPAHLREGHEEVVEVQKGDDSVSYFIFEATRYSYVQSADSFMMPDMDVSGSRYSDFHSRCDGLTDIKAKLYQSRFGSNKIPFERKTVYRLLSDEIFTYFYFYQFIMYVVWFWFSYLIVASVEASVVILGAVVSVYIQWKNQKTIASLTEYETEVHVKRQGEWRIISSDQLVPGDAVRITQAHWVLPCDMVLLSGSCILNESGLTGESMPVQKTSCINDSEIYDSMGNGVRHTVFAGTTVLQIDGDKNGNVLALVTRTSTGTSKGQLISTILYPEQLRFRYEEELEVVIVFLLLYGILAFGLSCYLQEQNGSDSYWITKWAYGMFTVSQIFSPLLPVALKVGQIRSSQRLSEKQIFCVNPRRIAISGKVTVFCFDKTGTLTKEGMEFSGISLVNPDTKSLTELIKVSDKTIADGNIPPLYVHCMATCHSVAIYGQNEFVGNEVEVNMFSSTGWSLQQVVDQDHSIVTSPDKTTALKVLRKYEFDHGRQTMSVIVEDSVGCRHVFCKGSFEKIEALCTDESIPEGFALTARGHALNGGYVLGFSHRVLDNNNDVDSISRDDIENTKSFTLLGLMIFRNEPKADSRDAILLLRDGAVRPVMITGDNAQCGQYISRSCGLVDDTSRILLAETNKTSGEVTWTFMGSQDTPSLKTDQVLSLINDRNSMEDGNGLIELAVSGNGTIEWLDGNGFLDTLMMHIRIYARTSPDSKSMIVKRFRALGHIVGMCGDGGNGKFHVTSSTAII